MMKRLLAAFFMAFALVAAPSARAEDTKLSVIVFPGVQDLPMFVAQAKGFYAKRGLNVDLKFTVNSDELRGGLAEGKYQIAHSAIDNAFALKDKANADIAVVLGGDNSYNHLIVQPEIASLADDVLFITLNGLSKNYRSCGYRAGWMVVSGEKRGAKDYIEGLNILASMRLCSNAPGQYAIQTALGGHQSINDLVAPGGRLYKQRDIAHRLLTEIPGVTCVKPKSALYMFPRLDPEIYPIKDDQEFAYELLAEEKVLIVQGTGFNCPTPDHFRVVFLPNTDDLTESMGRIAHFLEGYRRRHGTA